MNRNDLQSIMHYSIEITKLLLCTKECIDNTCDYCGYFAICEANDLLRKLIKREHLKLEEKGELKHDNH